MKYLILLSAICFIITGCGGLISRAKPKLSCPHLPDGSSAKEKAASPQIPPARQSDVKNKAVVSRKKRQKIKATEIVSRLKQKYPDVGIFQKPYSLPIDNPEEWAAAQFFHSSYTMWDYEDETPRFIIRTAEADLDNDGLNEVFISNTGSPNVVFLIFKKRDNYFFYIGGVWGHYNCINIWPKDEKGNPRVLTYERMGGWCGYINTFTYNGKDFELTRKKWITPGDGGTEEGRKIFRSYFPLNGKDSSLLRFKKLKL